MGRRAVQTGGPPSLTGRKWLSSKGKLALLFGFRTLGLARLSKTLPGCNKPNRPARATKGHEPPHRFGRCRDHDHGRIACDRDRACRARARFLIDRECRLISYYSVVSARSATTGSVN